MMKLDGVAAFIAVAEAGSISEASRRLGFAKSVVSERLLELERSLGARLLQRTTRKMSLTEDGLAFLERARKIIHHAVSAEAELAERRGVLVGSLRLSAPVSFGTLHLGPVLFAFLEEHPGIELTLDLDDRFVDVVADGYDAVIRHGPILDRHLVAKSLATSRRVLVASPDYLASHGAPRTLDELEQCRAILYTNRDADWRFSGPAGVSVLRPTRRLRVNNGLMMRDAALAGFGITLLPTFLIHPELVEGTLRVVELGAAAEGAEIYLAYAVERGASRKVHVLVDRLRKAFGDPPYWEAGLPALSAGDGLQRLR